VFVERCVGSGICNGQIIPLEESYRVFMFKIYDPDTSTTRHPIQDLAAASQKKYVVLRQFAPLQ
jgi:hypothetical protein